MGIQTIAPVVNRLEIVRKDLRTVKLGKAATWPQRELLREVDECLASGLPTRVIILKARQIGMSTMVEGITFAMSMIVPRLRSLVISNEIDGAEHLLQMTQHFWETFPYKALWNQKNKSAKHLSWDPIKSAIRIATARNTAAGRGRTLHILHASEVAFWLNAETLMTGLMQSIPDEVLSMAFLESTANGVGNYFHSMYEAAENGDIDMKALFFAFWQHPEYIARGDRARRRLTNMTEEERILAKVLQTKMSREEIRGRLLWRRWALANECQNDLDKFHQEFPSSPEEAFIVTGTNIFPLPSLNATYAPITPEIGEIVREGAPAQYRFQPSPGGRLKVFRQPERGRAYMVAADPIFTDAASKSDYACLQVLDRRTWEQVAVWRGTKIAPGHLGDIAQQIGYYYERAMICPERKGGGLAMVQNLLQSNYPFIYMHQKAMKSPGMVDNDYGWETNVNTKAEMISNLLRAVVDRGINRAQGINRGLVIHDPQTYREMKAFIRYPSGAFGNSNQEEYDDTVDALAICISACIYEAINLPTQKVIDKGGLPDGVKVQVKVEDEEGEEDEEPEQFNAYLEEQPDSPPWMQWGDDPDMFTGAA